MYSSCSYTKGFLSKNERRTARQKGKRQKKRKKKERYVSHKKNCFKMLHFIHDAYAMNVNVFKADGEAICTMSPYVTTNTEAVATGM
jgi:hypothetical protein